MVVMSQNWNHQNLENRYTKKYIMLLKRVYLKKNKYLVILTKDTQYRFKEPTFVTTLIPEYLVDGTISVYPR